MNAKIQEMIHSVYQEGIGHGLESLQGWKRVVYLVVELEIYSDMEGLAGFYKSRFGGHREEVANALEAIAAVKSTMLIKSVNALIGKAGNSSEAFDAFHEDQIAEFDNIESEFSENIDHRDQCLEAFVATASDMSAGGI